MGIVKDAVEGAGDFLLGGDKTTKQTVDIAPASQEEVAIRERIAKDLQDLIARSQGQQESIDAQAQGVQLTDKDLAIQELFRDAIKQAVIGANPDQMQQAEQFVDATFTRQAEAARQRTLQELSDRSGAQAAAQGRTGADSDTSDRFARQALQTSQDIALERGARIAQDPLRRAQAASVGLQGIGQIQQQNAFAPSFLTDLNTRALNNRLALMNAQTQGLNRFRDERFKGAGITSTQSEATGLIPLVQGVAAPIGGAMAGGAGGGGLSGILSGLGGA